MKKQPSRGPWEVVLKKLFKSLFKGNCLKRLCWRLCGLSLVLFWGGLLLCFSKRTEAAPQVRVTHQVIQELDQRKARRQAIDQATDFVTEEMVKQEIGKQALEKHKDRGGKRDQGFKESIYPLF